MLQEAVAQTPFIAKQAYAQGFGNQPVGAIACFVDVDRQCYRGAAE